MTFAFHVMSYINTAVLEALAKHFMHRTLMLLLNDTRGRGKYPEGALTHARIIGLACLEQ